uniref:N-acetyltransferase domain-containing protein n=1 Tax=Homalodisca liturata TaxID=320908 RepID=A0A1B6J9K0_9HEMI
MEEDPFKEITDENIQNVLDVLKKNCPRHFILHQYVMIMSNQKNNSQIKQYLYQHGDLEHGIYLVQTVFEIDPEELSLFFIYTTSNDLTVLKAVLSKTSKIPWRGTGYIFEVTMDRFTPIIGKAFVAKGLRCIVQHYSLMWLPPSVKVSVPDVPSGTSLRPLTEKHATEVAKNWPYFPGSEKFLGLEISSYLGLGIFRESDDKLICSALTYHSGGVFMLYTEPEVRRRGYGDIIIRYIVKEIRQRGWTPFCTVFPDNTPSLNLVGRIGFVEFDKADYIFPSQFFQKVSDYPLKQS